MSEFRLLIIFFVITVAFTGCKEKHAQQPLFALLSSEKTGVIFENRLDYTEELNAYTYRNFYNGAGVAVGDINNDGLVDIFFAGNLVDNKLFLNKGNFQFEDITEQAGLASPNVWSTGVSMADVNGDGLLDIYVCKSGPVEGENRYNELFINNGDLTFTEQAEAYGVADVGLSNHAAFFDYDKDGDLDFYLLNNSTRSVGIYDLRKGQRDVRDSQGGNKLYRNDGGYFTDVSEEAGIYGSVIGYGLGVTVADINQDHWPDIYISNDFFERDYIYLNQQDGTFLEVLPEMMSEISMGAMGADVVDLNNDGFPEVFVTEMLPDIDERVKTTALFENWNKYQANVKNDYHHQFTRNSLQYNWGTNPYDTSKVLFSEISRMKNMHATDWSWGALIFDADNDGASDVFVANGIYKDVTNYDYINFYANNTRLMQENKADSTLITQMIDAIPSVPLSNYFFEGDSSFHFTNRAEEWGLNQKVFSNGAAYADLDNDGDLDLIVNNINSPALIYQNRSRELNTGNYLQLDFPAKLMAASFGTKVRLYQNGQFQQQTFYPVKGYMSSMDPILHFGLGNTSLLDSLVVTWPDGKQSVRREVAVNQRMTLLKTEAENKPKSKEATISPLMQHVQLTQTLHHRENEFSDFDRDRLILQMSSNEGPAFAVADVDGNGTDDIFMGGAKGDAPQLWLQSSQGDLMVKANLFEEDKLSEDVNAEWADINGDGLLDLLVASGGYEFALNDRNLRDRVYLNLGEGQFEKMSDTDFPAVTESSAFLKAIDFDGDGDLDLVSGTRSIPFAYGVSTRLHFYENNGGTFKRVTEDWVTAINQNMGMIRDATVVDLNQDGRDDLIVVGDWMPIAILMQTESGFENETKAYGLENSHGLWASIAVADLNKDGLLDIVAGNMGSNTRLKASEEQPLRMYVNDFDGNGSIEQIITQYQNEQELPIVLLPDLQMQLPMLKKKFIKHKDYVGMEIEDLFEPEVLNQSRVMEVKNLKTSVFYQRENGKFESGELPFEAQISQTFAIHIDDFDGDGEMDLLIAGNQTRMKPEIGINNGSYGLVLSNKGGERFTALKPIESGLVVRNDTRQIVIFHFQGVKHLLFVRSNDDVIAVRKRKNE